MRILIIERQSQTCQSIRTLLDAWYQIIEIHEVANVCEALHVLEEFQPHAILMDVRLPKRNGLEGIRMIKAKYPQVKIIVLSLDLDFKAEVLEAGADAFVNKSDPPEELRETLKNILGEIK